MSSLRLGSLELQGRILLSPMEGVSDVGFRRLCYEGGAAFTFTEMIRARGIVKNNKSTLDLVDTWDADVPTGIQLMVVNERELSQALQRIEELAFSTTPRFANLRAVDLNFGCPSPEVVKIGAGPALLKRRAKMRAIFEALAAFKKTTKLPIGAVGAKIRLGLNEVEQQHKVYLPLVELAGEFLDYLIVHARHAKQRSRDKPTWSAIAECKRVARLPIIGNGDVVTGEDARRMFDETGCDGIMVARGAIKNPWVFRELDGLVERAAFTVEDVERAERAWLSSVEQHGTKEKFVEYHRQNFARLKETAKGGARAFVVPKNAHID